MGRYDQPGQKTPKALIIAVIILIVIAAILTGLYLGLPKATQENGVTRIGLPTANPIHTQGDTKSADSVSAVADSPQPVAEIETGVIEKPLSLPPLSESDALFRQEIERLSVDFAPELTAHHLIKKYLQVVNDFSQGLRISKHMRFLRLKEPFLVENGDQGWYIAERSYQRYDRLAQAFAAIDVELALHIYQKIRPLMLQVYTDFGYPDSYHLEDIFQKAAVEILAAPIIEHRIAVVTPSVTYKFADKKLEALNPIQKQMLRMGPDNTRMIQRKLRKVVERLATLNNE